MIRYQHPQGAVGIDPSYGLTYVVAGDTYFDRVSKLSLTPTNNPTRTVNRDGTAIKFAKASTQRLQENATASSPTRYSFIALVNSSGTDTNYSSVFTLANSAATYRFQLRHTATNWNFYHNFTVDKLASGTYTAGRHVIVGTWDGASIRLYIDGVLAATTSVTGTFITQTDLLSIGSDSSYGAPVAGTYWEGDISLVGIALGTLWNGNLVKSLSDNPWQIFQPTNRAIWVPVGGGTTWVPVGGGTTPVTSDSTASYLILEAVTSDASAAYNIGAVQVSSDTTASYAIRTSALSDTSASYSIAAPIISDTSASYSILTAGAVTSDTASSYAIRGVVQSDASVAYELRGAVQASMGAGYDIRQSIQSDASAAYMMRGAVESDLDAAYAVLALSAVTSDLAASYAVTGVAGLSAADIAAITAAVMAALNATTIPVDAKKMNGAAIAGDGSAGNLWRGA
jgi:hypothetical protein